MKNCQVEADNVAAARTNSAVPTATSKPNEHERSMEAWFFSLKFNTWNQLLFERSMSRGLQHQDFLCFSFPLLLILLSSSLPFFKGLSFLLSFCPSSQPCTVHIITWISTCRMYTSGRPWTPQSSRPPRHDDMFASKIQYDFKTRSGHILDLRLYLHLFFAPHMP